MQIKKIELTQAFLREIFGYVPTDGSLYWKKQTGRTFRKNLLGLRAGIDGEKPKQMRINRRLYYKSHLVWIYHFGTLPKGKVVGHVDHNRFNNKIENLYLCDKNKAKYNTEPYKTNTSGITGVGFRRFAGGILYQKWVAYIKANRKFIHLGYFENKEDAILARKSAEIKYGFHENHGLSLKKTEIKSVSKRKLHYIQSFTPIRKDIWEKERENKKKL